MGFHIGSLVKTEHAWFAWKIGNVKAVMWTWTQYTTIFPIHFLWRDSKSFKKDSPNQTQRLITTLQLFPVGTSLCENDSCQPKS